MDQVLKTLPLTKREEIIHKKRVKGLQLKVQRREELIQNMNTPMPQLESVKNEEDSKD